MNKLIQGSQMAIVSDLSNLGLNDVAYVKKTEVEGVTVWAIHAADGTPLTTYPARDVALVAVRQHDLDAKSVH
ncbi:MAG: DUF1150 family protein [Bdellovibrionales bacterium]